MVFGWLRFIFSVIIFILFIDWFFWWLFFFFFWKSYICVVFCKRKRKENSKTIYFVFRNIFVFFFFVILVNSICIAVKFQCFSIFFSRYLYILYEYAVIHLFLNWLFFIYLYLLPKWKKKKKLQLLLYSFGREKKKIERIVLLRCTINKDKKKTNKMRKKWKRSNNQIGWYGTAGYGFFCVFFLFNILNWNEMLSFAIRAFYAAQNFCTIYMVVGCLASSFTFYSVHFISFSLFLHFIFYLYL